MIEVMGDFEGRVMRELEMLKSVHEKMGEIAEISARLNILDMKFGEQVDRMDAVQAKVNLTMHSLGEVRQEQVAAARVLKQSPAMTPATSPAAEGDGILPVPPQYTSPLVSPHYSPQHQFDPGRSSEDSGTRKSWMPKMDFRKFDGTDARIWLDGCESYFALYDIPENFKVTSASLHMIGDAAHWFHAYKLAQEWPDC